MTKIGYFSLVIVKLHTITPERPLVECVRSVFHPNELDRIEFHCYLCPHYYFYFRKSFRWLVDSALIYNLIGLGTR